MLTTSDRVAQPDPIQRNRTPNVRKRFLPKKGVAKKGAGCRMFAGKGKEGKATMWADDRLTDLHRPHPAQLGGASFSRQNL